MPAFPEAPRDATVIVQREVDMALATGRRVVHASPQVLVERWSDVCRRYPAVTVIGDVEFQRQIEESCHITAANVGNTVSRGRAWVEHAIDALPDLPRWPWSGGLEARGLPAFIVGAGPSLDRSLEQLGARDLRDHGLVFAVNAATRAVGHHICVGNESNDQRGKTVPLADAVLVTGPQAHPGLRREHPGRVAWVFAGELGGMLGHVVGRPVTPSCSSSTSLAVSLALGAGCDPIVLVGQDLAFPTGTIYAAAVGGFGGAAPIVDGAFAYDWSPRTRAHPRASPLPTTEPVCYVPAYGGDSQVPTVMPMAAVGRWISGAVAYHGRRRGIQTSELGMRIEGFAEQPLGEVLDALPVRPVTWAIHDEPLRGESVEAFRASELAALAAVVAAPTAEHAARSRLLDPWAFAAVARFLEERRAGPVEDYRSEYRRARRDRVRLRALLRDEARELLARLG